MSIWSRHLIAAWLLALPAGCLVVTSPPPSERSTREVGALDDEASRSGTTEGPTDPAPADGPSLESLRGDRNSWVDYRLLTQDDFQAKTSYVLWGNVLH